MKHLLFILLLAFVYTSCSKGGGSGTTPPPPPPPPPQTGCTGTPGTLFTAVRTIIRSNCAVSGCHTTPNPQSGINFSDDCQIIAQKSNIKSRAVDAHGTASQMPPPPSPGLSVAERQSITNWINAGGRFTD
ncbi:MAG: hypothetical protein ABR502_06505 [Chitinophagaceae bacterium]